MSRKPGKEIEIRTSIGSFSVAGDSLEDIVDGIDTALGALGGDVTGTIGANTVTKIRNRTIPSTAPTSSQVISGDGVGGWVVDNQVYHPVDTEVLVADATSVTLTPPTLVAGDRIIIDALFKLTGATPFLLTVRFSGDATSSNYNIVDSTGTDNDNEIDSVGASGNWSRLVFDLIVTPDNFNKVIGTIKGITSIGGANDLIDEFVYWTSASALTSVALVSSVASSIQDTSVFTMWKLKSA